MNTLTVVFLLAASVAFTESQLISSSCPDTMNGVEWVWAMDASSSVGVKRYQSGIDFIKWAILPFKGFIGDGPHQSRMALYEFDETQLTMFELETFKTAEQISNYVDTLRDKDQNGTDNFFVKGIDFARTNLFNKARAGVKKVLVFVADGWTDEKPEDIAAASKRAADDNIAIYFVGYELDISEKVAKIVVGPGNENNVFIIKDFTDVAKVTGCLGTPTPPVVEFQCVHGTPSCIDCPVPFFGKQCKQRLTCAHKPPVVHDGKLERTHWCHGHGNCTDREDGSPKCICDKCWTGEWCTELRNRDQPGMEECDVSNRCILYDTEWTKTNKSATVQHVCDLTKERCISDNIDCAFNVHTHIDKTTGRPVCDPEAPRKKCQCDYPIGYCIPLEIANRMFRSLAPKGAYVDKFFTGSFSPY